MHTSQSPRQPNLKEATPPSQPGPSKTPTAILDAISAYTDKKKKPKRNRSAFILFSIDIRKKTQQENLDVLNPNDKFVKIAQLWKELSEEERKIYEERAKQEKERYASELSSFCKSFPTEPIQRPRNHIKKPCNAYGYYLKDVKEVIRKESPDLRMCEVLRIVGERWKKLSSEDRQKYEKKAEASRKKFKAEITKQNNASKKASVIKRETGSGRGKDYGSESQSLENETLVCMDPILLKNEGEDKRDDSSYYEAPTPKIRRVEQENIRPNVSQQQRQPLMPTPINTTPLFDDISTGHSFMLGNESMGEGSTFDTEEAHLANQGTLLALGNLLGKVDQLRQSILLQMRLVSTKEQPLQFPMAHDYLALIEHLSQGAGGEFGGIPRLSLGGQDYRRKEF